MGRRDRPLTAPASITISVFDNTETPSTPPNSQADVEPVVILRNSGSDLSISLGNGPSTFSHSKLSVLRIGKEKLEKEKDDLALLPNDYKFGLPNAELELLKKNI